MIFIYYLIYTMTGTTHTTTTCDRRRQTSHNLSSTTQSTETRIKIPKRRRFGPLNTRLMIKLQALFNNT